MRCMPPMQPARGPQPGIDTHISRGSDTIAADLATGSMLARIIVSERVPSIDSSSRLSMPISRMLTGSVPCQSGRTVLTTAARLLAICGGAGLELSAAAVGCGCGTTGALTVTGTTTFTGPAASVTTGGGAPTCRATVVLAFNTRQLATKIPPNTRPPTTNAQKATIVNSGGP